MLAVFNGRMLLCLMANMIYLKANLRLKWIKAVIILTKLLGHNFNPLYENMH